MSIWSDSLFFCRKILFQFSHRSSIDKNGKATASQWSCRFYAQMKWFSLDRRVVDLLEPTGGNDDGVRHFLPEIVEQAEPALHQEGADGLLRRGVVRPRLLEGLHQGVHVPQHLVRPVAVFLVDAKLLVHAAAELLGCGRIIDRRQEEVEHPQALVVIKAVVFLQVRRSLDLRALECRFG